ncbi:hypothetical protein OV079_33460 [Nannocystis pusilla]|uniref:Uncharacterized protein n=1 Tax=Nannocystis pusilla TaxID=889268 RepID=A0A9X3J0A6_9BACT|nr:hypothetical protein [Nannocystis pusilla]MCY1010391.1 hypothetical protein [Nannocystis pusilla]
MTQKTASQVVIPRRRTLGAAPIPPATRNKKACETLAEKKK